ncbi:DnaJ domain-containing protein [Elusimicrobiota bacterium]
MRRLPPWVFLVAGLAYILWPWDIAMDFLGFVGWIDDLIVAVLAVSMAIKALRHQVGRGRGARGPSREAGSRPAPAASASPPLSEDPCEILGLRPGAAPEDIKAAYRREIAKYHPDKVEHLGDDLKAVAERKTKLIQQAYEELSRRG